MPRFPHTAAARYCCSGFQRGDHGCCARREAAGRKARRLETARNWSPRVISKLETHIRSADDDTLFRINPHNFAAEKNISENETIDLVQGLAEADEICVTEDIFEADGVAPELEHLVVAREVAKLRGIDQDYPVFRIRAAAAARRGAA